MGLGGGMIFPQLLPLYWSRFNGIGYSVGTLTGVLAAVGLALARTESALLMVVREYRVLVSHDPQFDGAAGVDWRDTALVGNSRTGIAPFLSHDPAFRFLVPLPALAAGGRCNKRFLPSIAAMLLVCRSHCYFRSQSSWFRCC